MAVATNPLITQTFHGIPGGMNLNVPPQEIPDNQARFIQDFLLDNAGELRKRGPLVAVPDVTVAINAVPQGMFQTVVDDGTFRFGLLTGTTTPQITLIESSLATIHAQNWGTGSWATPPVYQAKPGLQGSTLLGTAPSALATANAALGMWAGSTKADYSTGTITTSQGSQALTGSGTSFTANVEPGAFVFKVASGNLTYLGQVATVNSNTSITLRQGAWQGTSGVTYIIKSVRGISVRAGKGRITVASGQTTVIGAGTKFNMITQIGDTWHLHRASDMTKIGQINTITNNSALVLSAGSTIDVSNEQYIAVREQPNANWAVTQNTVPDGLGFLTTVYQGRQFYANLPLTTAVGIPEGVNLSTRVWWSELFDPEAVDMSATDGDFFQVASQGQSDTPIMAIVGLQNAMAILKENELFALYGSDPTNFNLKKVADIGTISPMSVVQYRNAIIFAGRQGVYSFDGVNVQELSGELGNSYLNAMTGFDAASDRAYASIFRDHYIVSFTHFDLDYSPMRGNQATDITAGTLVLNLDSGAFSWMTNMQFVGWANLPPSSGFDAWFTVQDNSAHAKIIDAHTLWTAVGKDTVTGQGQTAGPSLYLETKRFDLHDAERKKLFKQLAMHYKLAGDTLTMDTVPGMGETGITASTAWLIQSDFKNSRIKFLKRDTHIGYRLYETNNSVTDAVIGPFAIAFKNQRVGRI